MSANQLDKEDKAVGEIASETKTKEKVQILSSNVEERYYVHY